MDNSYQVMTTDNKSVLTKGTEIDRLEKSKDHKYQESGVNPDNESEINIKETPFNLEDDK